MIKGFQCPDTEKLFNRERGGKFQAIERSARRKLEMLNAAASLHDLKSPGNQLEKLEDDRKGQHSIRINDQWRICFVWQDGNAHGVEIVDYH